MGSVLINSIDLESAFNVLLDKGGLSVFENPPKPKEPFYNDWKDQSGKDYDESAPMVYESQVFDIPFVIHGNGISDYRHKKAQFLELIETNNEFDFQILNWEQSFRLRYKECVSWGLLNKSMKNSMFSRFVLKLECNFNASYGFKYLVANDNRYIVANNGDKILVKAIFNSKYGE